MSAPHTRESDRKLRSAIANISIPCMDGDNLAVTLCSHFDNPDQAENEHGWTPDAEAGCEETLDAIVEAVRRISTPIPLTPSDGLVQAAKRVVEWAKLEPEDMRQHEYDDVLIDLEKAILSRAPTTPSDEMVAAGRHALLQNRLNHTPNGFHPYDPGARSLEDEARDCITAALNLMGGDK